MEMTSIKKGDLVVADGAVRRVEFVNDKYVYCWFKGIDYITESRYLQEECVRCSKFVKSLFS